MTENGPVTFLDSHRRALTERERRLIRARIRGLQARSHRARTMAVPLTAGVLFVLWSLTMMASDAPWMVITAFWTLVGGGIAMWVRRDMRRDEGQLNAVAAGLSSASTRNEADVYDVRAVAFAEFEEIEDEGACYAFELDNRRLVFVMGQEFYPGARFPSLDFSLVHILDDKGNAVDMLIEKRGARTAPARTIPAAVKRRLTLPEHLEVRAGTVHTLEDGLESL